MKFAAIVGGVVLLSLLGYGVKLAVDWFIKAQEAMREKEKEQ